MKRRVRCWKCEGTGTVRAEGVTYTCNLCNRRGTVPITWFLQGDKLMSKGSDHLLGYIRLYDLQWQVYAIQEVMDGERHVVSTKLTAGGTTNSMVQAKNCVVEAYWK